MECFFFFFAAVELRLGTFCLNVTMLAAADGDLLKFHMPSFQLYQR